MPDPISVERIQAIRYMQPNSLNADAPHNPDVWDLWAARNDLLAEVEYLTKKLERAHKTGRTQTLMLNELTSTCMAAEMERDARLPAEHVERFLKRERDEYEPRGECWNTVNDVLDGFRLHMVTGTALTEPRPQDGPGDDGAGDPPLTEAEELRAERDRLRQALLGLLRKVLDDQAPSYVEGLVPDGILAEALDAQAGGAA